jgi:hypothetical protein
MIRASRILPRDGKAKMVIERRYQFGWNRGLAHMMRPPLQRADHDDAAFNLNDDIVSASTSLTRAPVQASVRQKSASSG